MDKNTKDLLARIQGLVEDNLTTELPRHRDGELESKLLERLRDLESSKSDLGDQIFGKLIELESKISPTNTLEDTRKEILSRLALLEDNLQGLVDGNQKKKSSAVIQTSRFSWFSFFSFLLLAGMVAGASFIAFAPQGQNLAQQKIKKFITTVVAPALNKPLATDNTPSSSTEEEVLQLLQTIENQRTEIKSLTEEVQVLSTTKNANSEDEGEKQEREPALPLTIEPLMDFWLRHYALSLLEDTRWSVEQKKDLAQQYQEWFRRMRHIAKEKTFLIHGVEFEMVFIPPRFYEGKEVISAFWLSKYELTTAQWAKIMDLPTNDASKKPVTNISPQEVLDFLHKIQDVDTRFSVPTLSQWYHAGKASQLSFLFLGEHGTSFDKVIDRHTWNLETSGGELQPVGSREANFWNIHDMVGNAAEMCLSSDEASDFAVVGFHVGSSRAEMIFPFRKHDQPVSAAQPYVGLRLCRSIEED